jgi:hypothetical protein
LPTGWISISRSFTTGETAQSLAVGFAISTSDGILTTGVDDAFLIAPRIHADDFESGDLSGWTATTEN